MTHVATIDPMSCEHVPPNHPGKDMKHTHSRFTLVEATALIAIMAAIVFVATPKFTARELTVSICSLPDSRRHAECLGTAKGPHRVNDR